MKHLPKKALLLLSLSIAVCILPLSNAFASKDQDAGDIAQALADRLSGALGFESSVPPYSEFKTDVATAIDQTFEDCVFFNPDNIMVRRVKGRYKIIEDTHLLFDFGRIKQDAQWAKAVIKYYGMNTSCFVGRPKSSFGFLLTPGETRIDIGKFYDVVVKGKAPAGDVLFPEQVNCVRFSTDDLKIQYDNWLYSIIDSHNQKQLFSFNKAKDEAVAAFVFINLYGFNQKCSIGGGQTGNGSQALPTFTYLTQVDKEPVKPAIIKFKKR